jgi:hypothetical protein
VTHETSPHHHPRITLVAHHREFEFLQPRHVGNDVDLSDLAILKTDLVLSRIPEATPRVPLVTL